MRIESKGYNIAEITPGVKLVAGSSVTVGTRKDLKQIAELVENSGLLKVKSVVTLSGSDVDFNGVVTCNLFDDQGTASIEFHTITYTSDTITGGDPIIIGGQLYMDGAALKCHLTAVPISSGAKAKKGA